MNYINYILIFLLLFTIPIKAKIAIHNIHNKISSFFSKNKEEFFHQELENIQNIELLCDSGNISIHTWKQASTLIEVTKQGTSQQLKSTSINIHQTEKILQIYANHQDPCYTATTHINIIIPEETCIKLATKQGNISIKNVSGSIYAHTECGNIEVIDGEHDITAKATSGNIFIQRESIKDHCIKAETFHGHITLQVPQYIHCHLTAQTKHGKIYSNLFITLLEQTIKLNEDTYKHQRHNIIGKIVKHPENKVKGSIQLTTHTGTIKVNPYI